MSPGEKKSHRLNQLLTMAVKGKSLRELELQCESWGLSDSTTRNYLKSIAARLGKKCV